MTSITKTMSLSIVFVLTGLQLWAQTPVPGGGSSVGAPLDGFTSLLLAAGVGYGVNRMRDTASK